MNPYFSKNQLHMKKPKSVDEYISNEQKYQEELVHLRKIVLSTGLKEHVKWLFPCYTYNKKNVVGIAAFKDYFGLWFYQGALLSDHHNKLINAQEGKTQAMRQWRMKDLSDIDRNMIIDYISESIENVKAENRVLPTKKPIIESVELSEILNKDQHLRDSFDNLIFGRRRDYHEYINSAKRSETKKSRIAKSIPLILQEIGLSDKYRK